MFRRSFAVLIVVMCGSLFAPVAHAQTRATPQKHIPWNKEKPDTVATKPEEKAVENKPAAPDAVPPAPMKEKSPEPKKVEEPCGSFFGCHKVITAIGGVVLGTAATMGIVACAKGKGMCGGNTSVDVKQTVTVNRSRIGLGFRVPIMF